MNDCIFCKIVNNEIPAYKVYEDDDVLAFLDISQATPGHTLVIPKKHTKDIFELDSNLMATVYEKVNLIAKDICTKLNATNVNIINNNGILAGQTVFHYHVHILPRFEDDDNLLLEFKNDNSFDIASIYEKLI